MRIKYLPLLLLSVWNLHFASAQDADLTPWQSNRYGNEWIDYSKAYVRVGVPADGVYRVRYDQLTGLPGVNAGNVQVFRRGKEIKVLTTPTEVIFYGLKNDGASDGLLFRPNPQARLNQNVSFFSEEGSYFFTVCTSGCTPARIQSVPSAPQGGATFESYHWAKLLRTYSEISTAAGTVGQRINPPFAFWTNFSDGNELNQSYYTSVNSFTSPIITPSGYTPAAANFGNPLSVTNYLRESFQLVNWVAGSSPAPKLEFSVHGYNSGISYRQVEVLVAPDASTIQNSEKQVSLSNLSGFVGDKISGISLNETTNLAASGAGVIQFQKQGNAFSKDLYGVGYYKIEYPQQPQMINPGTSYVFEFRTGNPVVNIQIGNVPTAFKVLNVTDPTNVSELTGASVQSGVLTMSVSNATPQNPLRIMLYNTDTGLTSVAGARIYPVDFTELASHTPAAQPLVNGTWNPSAYDYLIVTSNKLGKPVNTSPVTAYAEYRSGQEGGSHRVLAVDIRNLYDQFNYGEPSVLAIRRFVDFMLKDGVRTGRHNLFLIGNSASFPNRVRAEMPEEVPTYGDPGSDILTVAGLRGANENLAVIPVGRLAAFTTTEVANYFAKVKTYELQTATETKEELAWRKNVVHIVGGQNSGEVSSFSSFFSTTQANFSESVNQMVVKLEPSRQISTLTNSNATTNPQGVFNSMPATPLYPLINAGVGMVSYYGHGSQNSTLYDIGKVSAIASYTQSQKYPFIYFNGCGVGNVFTSHTVHSLSTDWLVTPGKGSVAILGNSYKSYVSPTRAYLPELYNHVFLRTDAQRKTVGEILVESGRDYLMKQSTDLYWIANVHQSNLYGDPALRMLASEPSPSLPVNLVDFRADMTERDQVQLAWETAGESNNSHFLVERSYNGNKFDVIGRVEASKSMDSKGVRTYRFLDTKPFPGINYYRLKQFDTGATGGETSTIVSVVNSSGNPVVLFPNPAKDMVKIKSNLPVAIAKWTILDVNGREYANGKGNEIQIGALSGGSYYIQIVTENGDSYYQTVVKQ